MSERAMCRRINFVGDAVGRSIAKDHLECRRVRSLRRRIHCVQYMALLSYHLGERVLENA
jgi:hypothetical protein